MAGLKERFKDLSLYAPGSLSIHSNGSLKQMLKLMLPQTISGHKKMLLELFSGTGSVGKPFREAGWDVISVDLDGRFNFVSTFFGSEESLTFWEREFCF